MREETTDQKAGASQNRDDYESVMGIAAWWAKDGAWHIALPCADPDPQSGLKTGGFHWTEKEYSTRESAIAAIELGA